MCLDFSKKWSFSCPCPQAARKADDLTFKAASLVAICNSSCLELATRTWLTWIQASTVSFEATDWILIFQPCLRQKMPNSSRGCSITVSGVTRGWSNGSKACQDHQGLRKSLFMRSQASGALWRNHKSYTAPHTVRLTAWPSNGYPIYINIYNIRYKAGKLICIRVNQDRNSTLNIRSVTAQTAKGRYQYISATFSSWGEGHENHREA